MVFFAVEVIDCDDQLKYINVPDSACPRVQETVLFGGRLMDYDGE